MVFGNGMVLQREKEIAVWGQAEAGSQVKVTLSGEIYGAQTVITETAKDGAWSVLLPAGAAERGMSLVVTCDDEQIAYQDVCLGEVWIAGGQSNMEYLMKYDADREAEFAKEPNPDLRCFDYPEVSYEGQWEEFPDSNYGFWRKADSENLPWFLAVGYYFAGVLQRQLGVPVGILGCNWGGTPACAWQDPEGLRGTAGEGWLTDYEEAVRDLDVPAYEAQVKAGLTAAQAHPGNPMEAILFPGFTHEQQIQMQQQMAAGGGGYTPPPMGPMHQNRPGGLYETMLKKVAPYTARGVIWYQGESDEFHAEAYCEVFGGMIRCWRQLWKDELPFIFSQLAPFEEWLACLGTAYPELRHQQDLVSKTVPQTWMASIGDAGMQYDIHPKHKKPVGERMAELALGHVYEQPELCKVPGLCDAPEFAGAKREEDKIVIELAYAEGLHLEKYNYTTIEPTMQLEPDQEIGAMELLDAKSETLTGWSVSIGENDTLVIAGVPADQVEIRFAWDQYYEVNLYNKAGIPVKPFRVVV